MGSNGGMALPGPETVAGDDRALFPRQYFALYHFQSDAATASGGGGRGGGGKSDGSKTNFTLMEKLFNIPRLREEGRGQAVPPLEEWRQGIRVASFLVEKLLQAPKCLCQHVY